MSAPANAEAKPAALLCAAWIAPMDGPPMRDAGIVVLDRRILAVGPARALRQAFPDAILEQYPNAVLMPGLVNAHVHLELSDLFQLPTPSPFVDWLMDLMRAAGELDVAHSVTTGIKQCLRFGVTTVGDISRSCAISRPAIAASPLRAVSYGEVAAMAQRRGQLDKLLAAAMDASCQTPRLTIGLSPHAPYTVEPAAYRRCLECARQDGLPLATHLAESPDEWPFLAEHSGPFRDIWEMLRGWDDSVPRFDGGPIRLARDLGLLDYPTLLAHVNYCDDDELDLLQGGPISVVYCPRTHAYFGHRPHRWREMLDRRINVAVGTDGCASSPNLNLVDDLRLLRRLAPEMESLEIWRLATTAAARAIQLHDQIGSLAAGKQADLVAFVADGDDPLAAILENDLLPTRVWIDGRPVTI